MGHTVSSQRIILDQLMQDLQGYARALRAEDRELFERILKRAFRHYGSIAYASSIHAWAFLILSILLEQEKERQDRPLAHGVKALPVELKVERQTTLEARRRDDD